MKKKKILILAALLVLSGSAIGLGLTNHTHDKGIAGIDIRNDHSGRTNGSGCHNETSTGGYHCH